MICIFIVREEVRNDGIGDGVDDVKDTRKIGVSKVSVVGRGFVVFGLSDVDSGEVSSFRRLI